MFASILQQIQQLVRKGRYRVTRHAEEELENDLLSLDDLKAGIESGTIVERQRDQITVEWKYVVAGWTVQRDPIEIVVKIQDQVVIITVYRQ